MPPDLLGPVWEAVQKYAYRYSKARAARERALSSQASIVKDRITARVTKAVIIAVTKVLGAPASLSGGSRPSYALIAARSLYASTSTSGPSERSTRNRVEREVTVRIRGIAPDILN